jgi:hypothetical protein
MWGKQVKRLLEILLTIWAFNPSLGLGTDIAEITQAIHSVRPGLSEKKVLRYANAVKNASQAFGVEALTLVAIARQESTFRENLPEGKAGEIGMLQIRKNWLSNPKFRRVFKNAKVRDLHEPEKAFLYAAWILKDLRKTGMKTSLPYWTFYNARNYQSRFKYYLRVKRHLSSIETGANRTGIRVALKKPETQARALSVATSEKPTISSASLLSQIDWHQRAIDLFKSELN